MPTETYEGLNKILSDSDLETISEIIHETLNERVAEKIVTAFDYQINVTFTTED
tara:strand:- start:131 stop:292 length:162 start_codon:yes stop_codon:yes gene_type:complete